MIKQYRKKPIVIRAVQYTGDNAHEIIRFTKDKAYLEEGVGSSADGQGYLQHYEQLKIKTLEGDLTVSTNDFVVEGITGEFYPVKPIIFRQTYDEV